MKQCSAPIEGHTGPDSAANCPQHGAASAPRAAAAPKSGGYPTSLKDLRVGDEVFLLSEARPSGRAIWRKRVLHRTATRISLGGDTRYRIADGREIGRENGGWIALLTDETARSVHRTLFCKQAMRRASDDIASLTSRIDIPYAAPDFAMVDQAQELVRRALMVESENRPDALPELHATASGAPYAYDDRDVVAVIGPTTRIWKTLDKRLEAAGVTSAQREAIRVFCPAYTRSRFLNLLGSIDALVNAEDVPPAALEAAETASQELFGILARLQGYGAR